MTAGLTGTNARIYTLGAVILLLAFGVRSNAQRNVMPNNQLLIMRAHVDFGRNSITITGQSFGTGAPTVQLDGVTLTVSTSAATHIVAQLPAAKPTGTY